MASPARSTRARTAAATLAAAAMSLFLASTAVAGGWASATLDSTPSDPGNGGTLNLGFTLLQHGVTPVDWGQPTVSLVEAGTNRRVTVTATPSGKPGHWAATITVPATGQWSLDIRHDLEVMPANYGMFTAGVAVAHPDRAASTLPAEATVAISPALIAATLFLAVLAVVAAAVGTLAWRRDRAEHARA